MKIQMQFQNDIDSIVKGHTKLGRINQIFFDGN